MLKVLNQDNKELTEIYINYSSSNISERIEINRCSAPEDHQ